MKRLILLVLTIVGVLVFAGCDERKVVEVVGDAPAIPTGVSSTTGDQQVKVYWPGNNDRGVTEGYGVYRYTHTLDGVDQYELLGTVPASAGVVDEDSYVRWYSYIDYNVTNGVTYYYAVNAYNKWGESDLSVADLYDTPRPEGDAILRDFHTYPSNAGFDFSRARIVRFDADDADVFFEYDPDLGAFFLFAGNDEVDIQDYGYTDTLTAVGWGDPGGGEGWSSVGWLELIEYHSYIIWTADNHYATIRVEGTNGDPNELSIHVRWAYQTAEGIPELKRGLITRPQHDANYGKRKG